MPRARETECVEYPSEATVDGPFGDVVAVTEGALAEEGFGVLCDVDIESTLREKLDREFRRYRMLCACNLELAYDALDAEPGLGALLPCNVAVYEADETVAVRAVDPERLLGIVENDALDPVAAAVRERLERVVEAVAADFEA